MGLRKLYLDSLKLEQHRLTQLMLSVIHPAGHCIQNMLHVLVAMYARFDACVHLCVQRIACQDDMLASSLQTALSCTTNLRSKALGAANEFEGE